MRLAGGLGKGAGGRLCRPSQSVGRARLGELNALGKYRIVWLADGLETHSKFRLLLLKMVLGGI